MPATSQKSQIDQIERKTRLDLLKQINDELLVFKKSPLYKERILNDAFPVVGEGDPFAKIMFIGEAPGKNEAKTGRPFCGASGRVLNELLGSIRINRESVYITNIVKDRPTNNRDPIPKEIEAYGPLLDRQIEIIRPKILATLGRFSMVYIMNKFGLGEAIKPISKIHGKFFETYLPWGKIKVVPLYHPAVALYNGKTKKVLTEDFKVLKNLV